MPTVGDIVRLLFISLILGVLYYIFHFHGVTDVGYEFTRTTRSVFAWLFDRWRSDWRETYFAHSHWIPLVSLWLVWLDRRALISLPRKINWLGLAAILFALAVHWAGVKSEQTRLSIASGIMLSWSIPFFICGWKTASRLVFPCGFLLFSLPLNFFDGLVHPLRIAAATISTSLLTGLGLDVYRAGPVIINKAAGEFRIDIADSPSSIFAVTAMVAYGLVCAYIIRTSPARRSILAIASIPLFILANILRSVIFIILASSTSNSIGERIRDHLSGPFMVLMVFGGLTGLALLFHRRDGYCIRVPAQPQPASGSTLLAMTVSLLVICAAAWWIPSNITVTHREEAGVNFVWPDAMGYWRGEDILYCHNPDDYREVSTQQLNSGDPCPSCGEPLWEMSPTERALLPPDTLVRKKRYESPLNRKVYLAIVLSGKYRSSIHRPEVCLVGPNSRIADSFYHEVPLADRQSIKVKVLEMVIQYTGPGGRPMTGHTYYAYWFASVGRETPSHLTRMAWMAADRLFRNESYRWAYLSLAGMRTPNRADYLKEVDDFLRQAYPSLITN